DRPLTAGPAPSPRPAWRPGRVGFGVVLLLLTLLVLVPVGVILLQGAFPRLDRGSWEAPFSKWVELTRRPELLATILSTLQLGGLVALLATGLGVLFGFLVGRTDLPGRRVWDLLLTIPFLTPPFIGAFAWILV